MYDTGELLPVERIPPGSVLLCNGPPMIGKRNLVLRLLAQGLDQGEAAVIVSTDDSGSSIYGELETMAGRDLAGAGVGIIDASGSQPEDNEGYRVETVGSPTDLTGVGIELSNLLEGFAGGSGTRIGFLSLSTMLLYSEPERVLRFLHVFGRRIQESGAVAFVLVHGDGLEQETNRQIQSFVDGSIDVRGGDGGTEIRVRGLGTTTTDWQPLSTPERPATEPADPEPRATPVQSPTVESLASFVESVGADRPTLTLLNFTGTEQQLSTIENYFKRLHVAVRTSDTTLSTPSNTVLLHRGDDLLAASTVADLEAAIAIADDDIPEQGGARTTELLDAVEQTTFRATGEDKRFLIQVSHTIEMLATRTGRGRIHAGFQELSRLLDDRRARRIYDRLVDSGLDVHVYGTADTTVPEKDWTVHRADGGELTTTWFVGFTAAEAERTGALVAEEHDEGYDGFWSYRSDLAKQLDAYLLDRYG